MAVKRIPIRARYGRQYTLDLSALAEGDRVATVGRSIGAPDVTVWTVVRKTPTQVVCESGPAGQARWRISDGKQVGQSYGAALLPLDDDEVIEARQARLMIAFRDRAAKLSAPDHRCCWNHQQRLAAVAAVAELAADTAEKMNALEAQRVKEETSAAR